MLRRFWRWFMGTPGPSRTDVLLQVLIEHQQRTQTAMLNAVAQVGEASSKQAEVLSQYLKLFQGGPEPRSPSEITMSFEEENERDLRKNGYPFDASEQDQVKWVLENMDKV